METSGFSGDGVTLDRSHVAGREVERGVVEELDGPLMDLIASNTSHRNFIDQNHDVRSDPKAS